MRWRLGVLGELKPHERETVEAEIQKGKTLVELFPSSFGGRAYPAPSHPETLTALRLRNRTAKDAGGSVLGSELDHHLARAGVDDDAVRDFWHDLVATADDEVGVYYTEKAQARQGASEG